MASTAQISYINSLRTRVAVDPCEGMDLGALDSRAASALIDNLKTLQSSVKLTVSEGFYRLGEEIVEVKLSKAGRTYGLLLDEETGRFNYDRGLIFRIEKAGQKLDLEFAEEFGRRTGRCCICGRTLTVKASILRGIGPVCAKRF